VLLTLGGIFVAWLTSSLLAPVFHCATGWIIRPFASLQIRYYVRHSSILLEAPNIWKRLRRFFRGVPVNTQESRVPRPSPVSQLLEKWLSGNRAIDNPQFTGPASYVLFVPSGWGKTKACEYFMHEKKAKGVSYAARSDLASHTKIQPGGSLVGSATYFLVKIFASPSSRPMKDEAGCLPIATYAKHSS
jgi:hypothetical protein